MFGSRSLLCLLSLGLEFWLPLPLLGLLLWAVGGVVSDRLLSSSYQTAALLQANTQLEIQPLKRVLSIKVEIKNGQGFSKVKVKTATKVLKELEFELSATEFSQVEAAIGQELGLSPLQVRQLVRYQIED